MGTYYHNGGFYSSTVHSSIPSGAVEITPEYHTQLLADQEGGKVISDRGDGYPVATDRVLSLGEAIRLKQAEIEAAFAAAEATPVSVNGWLFKGGFTSGLAIDAQRRLVVEYAAAMPELGITTVDFFDIHGNTITVPIASDTELDSLDVTFSIGFATKANTFKYAQKMAAIGTATTIEEVQAITW